MNDDIYTIFGIDIRHINWFPESVIEEILQNVAVLITTVRGSVVLDRNLGLSATFIDEPAQRSMAMASIFLLETIREYEPRVDVQLIDFVPNPNDAMDGRFYPRVVLRIIDAQLGWPGGRGGETFR